MAKKAGEQEVKVEEAKSIDDNTLSRDFAIMTYLKEEIIVKLIKSMSVKHFAYAYHDKDDKEPHYHVLLRMNNPTTAHSIKGKFKKAGKGADNGLDVNTMVQYARDMSDLGEYLTHENQPNKYHYNESIIVRDDIGYFRGDMKSQATAGNEENTAYQILSDLEKGTSWREMAKRYGREIIINHAHYQSFLDMIRYEEMPYVRCGNCRYALIDMDTGEFYCSKKTLASMDKDKPRKCELYRGTKDYDEIIEGKRKEIKK